MKLPNNFGINLCLGGLRFYGFWVPEFSQLPIWVKILYIIRGVIAFMLIEGIYVITQIIAAITSSGDINELIGIGFLLLSNVVCAFKIIHLIYRQKEFVQIIEVSLKKKMEVTHPDQLKIIQRYEWANLRGILMFFFLTTFTITGWTVGPINEGIYKGENRKLPMEAWYPYNKQKSPAYEISYTHQIVGILASAYTNVMFDNLMGDIISLASLQIELLMFSLEHISPTKEIEEIDENGEVVITTIERPDEEVYDELRNCIKYHQDILEMTDIISLGVNPVAFAQLSFSSIIICLTLYQLSVESSINLTTTVGNFLYLGCLVWQLFLYCWHGNELRLISTQLILSSYKSKWYDCSVRTQKIFIPLMARSLQPIQITAGYIVELSLDTYMAVSENINKVLKSAYSFYSVISQAKS